MCWEHSSRSRNPYQNKNCWHTIPSCLRQLLSSLSLFSGWLWFQVVARHNENWHGCFMPDLCCTALFAARLGVSFGLLHLQLWVVSQFGHRMSGSVVEFLPATRETVVQLPAHAYMTFGSKCEESTIHVYFVWFEEGLAARVRLDSSITKVSWCHQILRLDGRPFLHRLLRWSVPDEVMSQTWFFGGVLIHRARYHANAEQRQGYFCSGSLLEVPLCIDCFNLISKMVFPLPNSTANQYCDYPGDDTFCFWISHWICTNQSWYIFLFFSWGPEAPVSSSKNMYNR